MNRAQYCAAPVPLAHLLCMMYSPPCFAPVMNVRRPNQDNDEEAPQRSVIEILASQESRSATQKANFQRLREKRFRRVMAGNGQMPAKAIATALHTTRDNIGSSLLLLINDGVVKRTGHGVATRYEWVAA